MESISHLLKLLSQFKVVSALEVNTFKTEAMWLGKWNNRSDTPFNFNWPIEPNCAFVVVVFFFSPITPPEPITLISMKNCENMEKILNIWKNTKLTLIRKRNIVKTVALSKLIFNGFNLTLPINLFDKINSMIYNFIWQGKPLRIN